LEISPRGGEAENLLLQAFRPKPKWGGKKKKTREKKKGRR